MINIGIIGCNHFLNAYLQSYKELCKYGINNFRIKALVDKEVTNVRIYLKRGKSPEQPYPASPYETGDPLGASATYQSDFQDEPVGLYTDDHKILEDEKIDAVNGFTPLFYHHQIGKDDLRAGKQLLTEKPLSSKNGVKLKLKTFIYSKNSIM